MEPRQVKTAADARRIVKERGLSHVKVGVHAIDGILRGKYIHIDKFHSALDGGMGFSDVVLGWDANDQLYDNVTYTGWHTGYPDANVRLLPETCREIATEPGNLLFLCEFVDRAEELCPRGVLRRVLARAKKMGFEVKAGFEYEFFVFAETAFSIREKGYKNLKPISPGFFGYSVLRNSVLSDWYKDLLAMCETMDMGIEGLHTETGAGVLEAALRVCGGHMHMSLWKDGKPVFFDDKAPHRMSRTMRQFVGGQQALMPELLGMVASTVNAYRRLIPGFWAPTVSTWGVENRTCALRVIPGSAKSTRVEYRIAAADANPYLALAAALGSGLWGIENKIDPGEPIKGNSYDKKHPAKSQLPRTLMDAAGRLKASKAARELFGEPFVDHYSATRDWEEREFRKAITDWELERYMEII